VIAQEKRNECAAENGPVGIDVTTLKNPFWWGVIWVFAEALTAEKAPKRRPVFGVLQGEDLNVDLASAALRYVHVEEGGYAAQISGSDEVQTERQRIENFRNWKNPLWSDTGCTHTWKLWEIERFPDYGNPAWVCYKGQGNRSLHTVSCKP
jgi:hypothetical protein